MATPAYLSSCISATVQHPVITRRLELHYKEQLGHDSIVTIDYKNEYPK